MSIFKIVGNYYEDILDFFTREYKKINPAFNYKLLEEEYLKHADNPGSSPMLAEFKQKFEGMFDLPQEKLKKKVEIIKLLANTYMKLDRIRTADQSYWEGRARTYLNLVWVLIVMAILLAYFVMIYLRGISLETMTPGSSIPQLNIGYITIYTIILSFIIIVIINLKENINMCHEKAKYHLSQFSTFSMIFIPNVKLQYSLASLGYNINNQVNVANKIMKHVGKKECPDASANETDVLPFNTDVCKNKANLEQVYDDMKNTIRGYISSFYSYGHGYSTVRKAVVKSSTNYMLREVRNVMSFYYYLLNKRGDYDVEKQQVEMDRKVIDKVIIKKLETMKIGDFFGDPSGTSADTTVLIQQNEDVTVNPEYVANLAKLSKAIIYLCVFLYPLYIKQSITSSTVMQSPLNGYIPFNISTDDDFSLYTKTYFQKKSGAQYDETVELARNSQPEGFNILIANHILVYKDYMSKVLNDLLLVMKGNSLFPLQAPYITKLLDTVFTQTPLNAIEVEYKTIFQEAFIKALLPAIQTDMESNLDAKGGNVQVQNMINFKMAIVIDSLSQDLSNYTINIKQHSHYILDSIIKDHTGNIDDKLLNIFKRIILKLDQAIELKRRIARANDKTDRKLITSAEFVSRINDLMFHDLERGLDTFYLYEILNDFYMDVSGAIGTSEAVTPNNRTDHNIFYAQQKKFKIANTTLTFVYIIIAEFFVYYLLSWMQNFSALNAEEQDILARKQSNPDDINAKNQWLEHKTKKLNSWVKIIIPLLLCIFMCVLLFSYYTKATDAFKFNRDTIETNTSDLIDAITKLDTNISAIRDTINNNTFARIVDIKEITEDMKVELYANISELVDKYEKCNYIINVSQTYLPFPYTEVTIDMFMIAAIVLGFVYVMGQMNPYTRLLKIRKLQKMREDIMYQQDSEASYLISLEKKSHEDELDTIVFALKLIFFIFVFMFLIFYIINIISSTGDFKNGLYNSAYFEESRCYSG